MRKIFITFSVLVIIAIILGFVVNYKLGLTLSIIFLPICLLGWHDLMQKAHTIRSNFPVLGRLRYFMEDIRPKIYQYFVESDTNGAPFNRLQRTVIYQRSKKMSDTTPFGTQLNVYEQGYEWVNHSIGALDFHQIDLNPKTKIGSSQCTKPYMCSLFNISAMSFGSLSKNAIIALNEGAKLGGFYHNTGEGGLSPYHLRGGDVVWNIGTGYFSCRTADGKFSEIEFEKRATLDNVKMIEIKFSQGAKPGHGGILPKQKVTEEIASIRLVPMGNDIVSPPFHTAFTCPTTFVRFVAKLRELSGGKPIGMKICIGNKSEFVSICKAMVQEKVLLDFITVDGGEGGTGAAPIEFSDHVGMPLRDAVAFVYDCLVGFGLKKEIKIIASGRITNGFEIVKALSIGADITASARGMMFALGCIQALECNKNSCPAGIATQNQSLMKGLDPTLKSVRVANYQSQTVKSALELIGAAGISHPDNVGRDVIHRRIDEYQIKTYLDLYPELAEGCLLDSTKIPLEWQPLIQKAKIDAWR